MIQTTFNQLTINWRHLPRKKKKAFKKRLLTFKLQWEEMQMNPNYQMTRVINFSE